MLQLETFYADQTPTVQAVMGCLMAGQGDWVEWSDVVHQLKSRTKQQLAADMQMLSKRLKKAGQSPNAIFEKRRHRGAVAYRMVM
jgi:hypothetical protein